MHSTEPRRQVHGPRHQPKDETLLRLVFNAFEVHRATIAAPKLGIDAMPGTVLIDGVFQSKLPEYGVWKGMYYRCLNPDCTNWANYGGRGITVCKEWLEQGGFERFLRHIGRRPSPKHQIDRIDNNGNYCEENCRWATKKEQSRNKRDSLMIEYKGKKMSNM